ncbi:MAG TPA: hypothetical protein PKE00_15755, partial [Planctomycetota bacterium]|nr:hypothetical protein [Planctomycetota bacterium]
MKIGLRLADTSNRSRVARIHHPATVAVVELLEHVAATARDDRDLALVGLAASQNACDKINELTGKSSDKAEKEKKKKKDDEEEEEEEEETTATA